MEGLDELCVHLLHYIITYYVPTLYWIAFVPSAASKKKKVLLRVYE